jgi:hypothetical protein
MLPGGTLMLTSRKTVDRPYPAVILPIRRTGSPGAGGPPAVSGPRVPSVEFVTS